MLERILGYDTMYYSRLIENFAIIAAAERHRGSKKRKRGTPQHFHS